MAYPFKFKAKPDQAPKGKAPAAGIVSDSPRAKMLKGRGKKKKKAAKKAHMMEMDA